MTAVVVFEDGYKIADKILFGVSEIHSGYINCKTQIGPMMNYDKRPEILIDYPGDYDMQHVLLKVFDTKDQNLHYVIVYKNKKYVIVNHKSVLKVMDTNNVDVWIVPNQKIAEMLEKLEYEGEVVTLEELKE